MNIDDYYIVRVKTSCMLGEVSIVNNRLTKPMALKLSRDILVKIKKPSGDFYKLCIFVDPTIHPTLHGDKESVEPEFECILMDNECTLTHGK